MGKMENILFQSHKFLKEKKKKTIHVRSSLKHLMEIAYQVKNKYQEY